MQQTGPALEIAASTARRMMESERFVLITGCSGGGKSTLLTELGRRRFATVEEPGRRIVRQELQSGGTALPWLDPAAFLQRAVELSLADRLAASAMPGWVFFDRGLIDAVAGLDHLTGANRLAIEGMVHRYHQRIFLAPPWEGIYETDPERRHGFQEAVAMHERLLPELARLGYTTTVLPKVDVEARADFIEAMLD